MIFLALHFYPLNLNFFPTLLFLVTTVIANQYTVWTPIRAANAPFIIKAVIKYPMEIITYPFFLNAKKCYLTLKIDVQ